MRLIVDGKPTEINADPKCRCFWALRDIAGKTGPKFGCGIAMCGACTVHVGGMPVRSCSLPVGEVKEEVLTIEGLAQDGKLHPVQQAWLEEQVAQCGYCQAGQIMSAVALLDQVADPTDDDNRRGDERQISAAAAPIRRSAPPSGKRSSSRRRGSDHGQPWERSPAERRAVRSVPPSPAVRPSATGMSRRLTRTRWKATSPRARPPSIPT